MEGVKWGEYHVIDARWEDNGTRTDVCGWFLFLCRSPAKFCVFLHLEKVPPWQISCGFLIGLTGRSIGMPLGADGSDRRYSLQSSTGIVDPRYEWLLRACPPPPPPLPGRWCGILCTRTGIVEKKLRWWPNRETGPSYHSRESFRDPGNFIVVSSSDIFPNDIDLRRWYRTIATVASHCIPPSPADIHVLSSEAVLMQ